MSGAVQKPRLIKALLGLWNVALIFAVVAMASGWAHSRGRQEGAEQAKQAIMGALDRAINNVCTTPPGAAS